jgi:hypothetical protein
MDLAMRYTSDPYHRQDVTGLKVRLSVDSTEQQRAESSPPLMASLSTLSSKERIHVLRPSDLRPFHILKFFTQTAISQSSSPLILQIRLLPPHLQQYMQPLPRNHPVHATLIA